MDFTLLAAVPITIEWNFSVAIVMIFCNLFAIAIGRFAIQNSGQGPDLPIVKPALWKGFGLPELLATMSFGHILGAGMILGLSNAGVL
ncbi:MULTISPECIES: photosystem I reaction center subunit PsaK [Spirulina sp. CCY15215]|uniref:photosystem I reaction center subunit PsaK n=1 Tax=Spirulina sp. CCY15215 TaxID=2767591 RepID=UPI0019525DD4|nr:photosystem I reaction center subunit PsaK [Spirulina major]